MKKIIVTDLTRFSTPETVCTAGIDTESGKCIRPMPYLKKSLCERLKILPGAVLQGNFTPIPKLTGPHQEDHFAKDLKFIGPCSTKEFRKVLLKSKFGSVSEGFECQLEPGKKVIPESHTVRRSIITIAVDPKAIEIVEDSYTPGKIKVHFRDQSSASYRFLSITDLGFHEYAQTHREKKDLIAVNDFLGRQKEVFLRIGLGRAYKAKNGENGYWLQVNGIYTFPDYLPAIRSYAQ